MQYGFYYDQSRCTGCNTCIVACKDWNDLKPGPASWRNITVEEVGEYPHVSIFFLSMACNHCSNPACMAVCPAQAIYKRKEDGIVIIDRSRCTGCNTCAVACPFGAIQFADDEQEPVKEPIWQIPHPAQKCTLCWDRLANGMKPACVDSCLTRAIDAGPMDELMAKYPSAVRTVHGFPEGTRSRDGSFELESGFTGPNILFKPKPAGIPIVTED